jgi:hypothetical protein
MSVHQNYQKILNKINLIFFQAKCILKAHSNIILNAKTKILVCLKVFKLVILLIRIFVIYGWVFFQLMTVF